MPGAFRGCAYCQTRRTPVRYTQSTTRSNCATKRFREGEVLEAILAPQDPPSPVVAPALVAGEWRHEGPWAERIGPYSGQVVSRAPQAGPDDVAVTLRYARAGAEVVRALSPAARAAVLQRAAETAMARRDAMARLL